MTQPPYSDPLFYVREFLQDGSRAARYKMALEAIISLDDPYAIKTAINIAETALELEDEVDEP